MSDPAHDDEDMAFMSPVGAAESLTPRRAAVLTLWALAAFVAWVVMWASFSKIDERVRGTGQVMPSSDMQVVQSLEGGIVTEILVNEGARVRKDQVILRIDDMQFAAEGKGIEAQMAGLAAKQARLKAETAGTDFTIDSDTAKKYPDIAATEGELYRSRAREIDTALGIINDEVAEAEANISEVRANISKYAKSRELLQKELEITRRLVEKKAQPEIEQIRLERELNEVSGNLSSAQQAQQSLQSRLNAARRRKDERLSAFRSQALGELNDVEAKIASIRQNLSSVEDKVRRTELKSPVDGVVHKLHVKTVGGVVQPAQKLAEVVPGDDDLMVRARVSPADIAFLHPGQPVRVGVTAYDPQIYGKLDGTVERVSADTVEDAQGNLYFEIDVRTEKSYLGDAPGVMPILPGMVAEAEVIVGRRSIMTYLMKPVLRARDRALTEK